MSDFDKEAEREKLREQFERDREKRQQSERMSELLLKGATMTNKHHDCGSPVFRWNGEEFCPSCGGPDGEGATGADARGTPAEGGLADADATGGTAADESIAADEATGAADTADGAAEPTTDATDASDGTDVEEIDVTAEPAVDESGPDRASAGPSDREPRTAPRAGATHGRERTGGEESTGEGVATARASLERTLADVARQAEETSSADLTHKRNLIAAAREAAEALEATRRAGRQ